MHRNHTRQSGVWGICTVSFWFHSWWFCFSRYCPDRSSLSGHSCSYSDVCRAVKVCSQRYLNHSMCCSSFPLNNSPSFFLFYSVHSDFVLISIHSVLESFITCPYFELTLSTLSKRTWACLSSCVKRPISFAKRKLLIVLLSGSPDHQVPLA